MSTNSKPLAPTTRPKRGKAATTASPAVVVNTGPAPASTVSKAALIPVFVYGSLMQGHALHDWLKDQDFIAVCKIDGYALVSLGPYPALVAVEPTTCSVAGEYYLVSEDCFTKLKDMEEAAGYKTVNVSGTFDKGGGKFTARAFLMWDLKPGTYSWEAVTHNNKDYRYVGYTPPRKD